MTDMPTIRLITGDFANIENVVAKCHLHTHYGYLSKNLIKGHDCVAKECPHFERLNLEYWESREKAVQEKKNRRLEIKQKLEEKNQRDKLIRETLEACGNIHVTSIKENDNKLLAVSYIYDRHVNLENEIQTLRKKLKKRIKLTAVRGNRKAIKQLINNLFYNKNYKYGEAS